MEAKKKLRRCSAVIIALAILLAVCALGLFMLWQRSVQLEARGDVYESGVYEALEGVTVVWEQTADELSTELGMLSSGELSYDEFALILERREHIVHETFRIRLAWWNTVTCGQSEAGSYGPAKYGELNSELMRLLALLVPDPVGFKTLTSSELELLSECYGNISEVLNYRRDSFMEVLREDDATESELIFAVELFASELDEIERLVLQPGSDSDVDSSVRRFLIY